MSNNDQNAAALAEANGIVTPFSQVRTSLGITADDAGQFDFVVGKVEPQMNEKNGLYCVEGEFPVTAPAGFAFPYKRTLWIGTHKDPKALLPATRLNSPGIRFLTAIAKANGIPTNDQSVPAICKAITGRAFGCRIEKSTYKNAAGEEKHGTEFGRNVTPAGRVPAKLDRQSAAPLANGSAMPTGTQFAAE